VRTGIFSQDRTVGADLDEVMKDLPAGVMDASEAAARILHGVARKRETIVFPFSSRLLWWTANWFPSLLRPIHARLMRKFH
jgi:short-subunit dehydrogenase